MGSAIYLNIYKIFISLCFFTINHKNIKKDIEDRILKDIKKDEDRILKDISE